MDMTVRPELRPCLVRGTDGMHSERALFHRWSFKAWTHGAAITVGGFPAGQEAYAFAIIEREDGTVTTEEPCNIKFVDDVAAGFCWTGNEADLEFPPSGEKGMPTPCQ